MKNKDQQIKDITEAVEAYLGRKISNCELQLIIKEEQLSNARQELRFWLFYFAFLSIALYLYFKNL